MIRYVVAGLLLYILFLVTTIPASWLAWGLNKSSKGSITLSQAHGTVWHGSGQVAFTGIGSQPRALGNISWRLKPWYIFTGRLGCSLEIDDKDISGNIDASVSFTGMVLGNIDIKMLAQRISSLYSPATLLSPAGRISISGKEITLNKEGLAGKLEANWVDAASSLVSVAPLGSYALTMTGNKSKVDLDLSSKAGPLRLAGKGAWTLKNGIIQLNGTGTAEDKAQELDPILALMGRRNGEGAATFRVRERLNIKLPFYNPGAAAPGSSK